MRGSFKQTFVCVFKKKKSLKKKRSVEPFLCRTQPYFSSRLIRLFALQSANFSISLTCFILTHIFLAFIFFFSHLFNTQPVALSLQITFYLSFPPPLLPHTPPLSSTSLTVSVYYSSKNGKQRCHCGSILSAQRVADGRNLCRL